MPEQSIEAVPISEPGQIQAIEQIPFSEECPRCGEVHNEPGHLLREDNYNGCTACLSQCDECNHVRRPAELCEARRSFNYSSRQWRHDTVCADCRWTCADCARVYSESHHDYGYNADDERVCQSCSESYGRCHRCDHVFHQGNLYTHGDEWYCEDCEPSDDEPDPDYDPDDYCRPPRPIHDYGYKPLPIFHTITRDLFSQACEHDPYPKIAGRFYFGIEVEVENKRGVPLEKLQDDAKALCGDESDIYAKNDGSIGHGFEIVSHPRSIASWRAFDFGKIGDLARNGYASYQTSTCGMHVHIDRKALGGLGAYKLLLFCQRCPRLILRLSRRREHLLNQWAAIDPATQNLCLKVKLGNGHGERYTAVNCENHNTIEIRIFKGTLRTSSILRNIELCNALCLYVQRTSIRELGQIHFVTWLKSPEAHVLIGASHVKTLTTWIEERMSVSCA